ncbi:MAG: hypothetical protein ACK5JT_22365 [Hyphomicrobiaceae bacterium]
MFWLATAAFSWGVSLASYRWFAIHNGWPMGEWQAYRPGLPIAIGLLAVVFAVFFAWARGGETLVVLPLLGLVCALAWTAVTRVAAQSALILAPLAVLLLLIYWLSAANHLSREVNGYSIMGRELVSRQNSRSPAATDREGHVNARERGK